MDRAAEFVRRCRDPLTGGFRYQPVMSVTVTCTASGILGLHASGKEPTKEVLQAGKYLLQNPPRWEQLHLFDALFFGSRATLLLGGDFGKSYRAQVHKVLLDNQKANGSWTPREFFGPNFATALAVLALTADRPSLTINAPGARQGKERSGK
jgi:hypothetical protein